jgi:hypothetical protein
MPLPSSTHLPRFHKFEAACKSQDIIADAEDDVL